jgi:ketosteroid isomerase-like protein
MPNNLDIIKSTYEGSSKENGNNYQAYLSEDAEWTEATGFPYAGTYIGYEEISNNVFARLDSEWEGYKAEVSDYYEDGDTIIAVGVYSGTYKQTGKYFQADFVHIWKLKNKKIVKFKQFVDSYLVWGAMSPE